MQRALRNGFILLIAVASAGLVPLACGSEESSSSSGFKDDPSGGSGGEGGNLFEDDGGTIDSLKIEPPGATIDVIDGVAQPVDFAALRGSNEVAVTWTIDYSSIALVDTEGVVTATGAQGGAITLTANDGSGSATVNITVNVKKTINAVGVSQTDIDTLKGAVDPDASLQWAYPYDKTVFPKGLEAPLLMWNGGNGGDLYYVHMKGTYAELEVFTTADPPARYQLPLTDWQLLTESGKGGDVALTVTHLVPGNTSAGVVVNHTWTIARGSLKGTVYYWANNSGRIMRIKPGQSAPDDFLAAAGISDNCSTCHTVSADGSTLVIGGDVSTSTFNLIQGAAALGLGSVGKSTRNWAMPAVSPDGKVLVENNAPLPGPPGGSDGMWDTYTGQKLGGTGLDGVLLNMPAFSPSGKYLAYVDHNTLDLGFYHFDSATGQVSNPTILTPAGADGAKNCIAFPSLSPTTTTEVGERTLVVYHRGSYPGSLDTRTGPGDVYLSSIESPGAEWRLANINGDGYPFAAGSRDLSYNFEPTFAPVTAGGYAWVVFTSRRTYGNMLTGNWDQVKQLWVAAIDTNPADGVDPSHPPFWVPGQDVNTLNMRGFWALDPCVPTGGACGADSECCNGNCADGLCAGPDPGDCVETGDICENDADCCDPNEVCTAGECSQKPPQ